MLENPQSRLLGRRWRSILGTYGNEKQSKVLCTQIFSGIKVRNSIMKMLAPYPRKISVKMLCFLLNDFEVREVLFRSNKSKTDIRPYCRVVDDTAHFLFSCVLYQEHRRSFIRERKNQKIDETLVTLLNCENKHVVRAVAGFIASIDKFL